MKIQHNGKEYELDMDCAIEKGCAKEFGFLNHELRLGDMFSFNGNLRIIFLQVGRGDRWMTIGNGLSLAGWNITGECFTKRAAMEYLTESKKSFKIEYIGNINNNFRKLLENIQPGTLPV